MRNEAAEIIDDATTLRASRVARAPQAAALAATAVDLKIVDAAFADLETTILRCDNPMEQNSADNDLPAYQGVVQQLASQLRMLDDQRRHLATLLRDLQSPVQAGG